MSVCRCEDCEKDFDTDFYSDGVFDEAGYHCFDCYEKWFAEQVAYWKPLYKGEVLAGLVGRDD